MAKKNEPCHLCGEKIKGPDGGTHSIEVNLTPYISVSIQFNNAKTENLKAYFCYSCVLKSAIDGVKALVKD